MDRHHHARARRCVVAITPGTKTLSDYKHFYHRSHILICIGVHTVVSLSVGFILQWAGVLSWQSPLLWSILLLIFLLGGGLYMLLLPTMTEPMDTMLTALAHKVGDPQAPKPPHPNAKHYTRTGFSAVLQAIYLYADSQPQARPASDILAEALDHTSCGIVVLNPQKQIIAANSAAPVVKDATGEPYLALDFLDDQPLTDWLEAIETTAVSAERQWRRISTDPARIQQTRFFDITASYQRGAAGETVIVLFDRSDHYLPEEEDLNFIAFAAHELRGPVTIIRGYLDVLTQELADRLHGDEPQLLERLIVSASRLSSYINNILNVSRFDRHHLIVHLSEDRLSDIYASIADDMALRASTQQRILNVSLPENLPTVAADRGSISEVISNLIDNAIKYSFEGGVISVTAAQKGEFVELTVRDNGVGMPPNVVKNLFHKFYRSHRSRKNVAGTGIGLYICKAFVESHGGSISVRSREHEGSSFSFTVPTYASVQDRLLEDGQLNRQLIRKGSGWIKNHAMYRQ